MAQNEVFGYVHPLDRKLISIVCRKEPRNSSAMNSRGDAMFQGYKYIQQPSLGSEH